MEYFVDKSINKEEVNGLFKTLRLKYEDYELHTFQMYKGGKKVVRVSQEPYSCSDAREIYSLSKTFTSTIVGIAADMGLLSDEDYVLKYFPEIDAKGFENLKIKHLLSMNTGHESCVMSKMCAAENSVKAFFDVPLEHEPGTFFAYNTGATCLLAAVVERVSGEKFFDFACEKLFYPLGITNVYWSCCKDGICQAGTGLHISSDDIVKLGLMYYNGGTYNGKRILSEDWIKKASSPISDNSENGTADWTSGYGYQIWINSRDGYRGDGAFGQLCLVLEKHDVVCVIQGFFKGNMQNQIDEIFNFLDGKAEKEQDDKYIDYIPVGSCECGKFEGVYKLDENAFGFKKVNLKLCENELELSFSDGYAIETLHVGCGEWKQSYFYKKSLSPRLDIMNDIKENVKLAACFEEKDNKIKVHIRYLSNPHSEMLNISYNTEHIEFAFESSMPELREDKSRKFGGDFVG